MMRYIFTLLLITSCAREEPVLVAQEVRIPIAMHCSLPLPPPPPDMLGALPADSSVAVTLKTCLAQSLLNEGFQAKVLAITSQPDAP